MITDRQTDRPTDIVNYRVACARLKSETCFTFTVLPATKWPSLPLSFAKPSIPMVSASPIPVQFKNPLANIRKQNNDQKGLVKDEPRKGNVYEEVDTRKMDAPVSNQTFDHFAESL